MAETPSTEVIEVCPECDAAGPRTVVGHPIAPRDVDHDYRCPACGARFDEPAERPREAAAGRPSGLAGELYDREPEDLGEPVTDGGTLLAGGTEPTETSSEPQWRLRYAVGGLIHYTEWTPGFATVENLADQYRQQGYSVTIERREVEQ